MNHDSAGPGTVATASAPRAPQRTAALEGPMGLTHRRVLAIIFALMLGMLLAALDQTIVSTALPTIVARLHGGSHITWVVTAYLLAATVSTPLWGKLGDQYGRKTFFQASILIFLAGSIFSGLSTSLVMLVTCRAIQGLGGGGLMVGAQAIVGDVVSPRDRGRYQGLFGAVFGLASVAGPLLGGVLVDDLSWRWIFYVNIPVGAVALFVIASQVPGHLSRVHHHIDYAGIVTLSLGATGLVLLTSLGGTSYAWGSAPIILMGAGGAVFLAIFALIERSAPEPVLPLHLFSNRTFSVASAVGFIVGFAMFGALTFLPLFFQVVKGSSPTTSGLLLLPLMAGMLVMSIGSGIVISRTGRYRVFPIAGTAIMTVGLVMLSRLTSSTGGWVQAADLVVLGIGLGAVMQVLVLVTQNAVPHSELGVATSGATFFRSIGGSFGAAIFGAIFSNVLVGKLANQLKGVKLPAGVASSSVTPQVLAKLPAPVRDGFIKAYGSSIEEVFLLAVPVGILAFVVIWLLPHVELRGAARSAPGPSRAAGTPVTAGAGPGAGEPGTGAGEAEPSVSAPIFH